MAYTRESWNGLLEQVNSLAQNPPLGCDALPALPLVGPNHIWSKADVLAVRNKLTGVCDQNTFSAPLTVWSSDILAELWDAISRGWCGCQEDPGDPPPCAWGPDEHHSGSLGGSTSDYGIATSWTDPEAQQEYEALIGQIDMDILGWGSYQSILYDIDRGATYAEPRSYYQNQLEQIIALIESEISQARSLGLGAQSTDPDSMVNILPLLPSISVPWAHKFTDHLADHPNRCQPSYKVFRSRPVECLMFAPGFYQCIDACQGDILCEMDCWAQYTYTEYSTSTQYGTGRTFAPSGPVIPPLTIMRYRGPRDLAWPCNYSNDHTSGWAWGIKVEYPSDSP